MLRKTAWWTRLRPFRHPGRLYSILKMPTMLSYREIRYLYRAARDICNNSGFIVDIGCFLGGSTMSFARGIVRNSEWKKQPRMPVIHSYDLFRVEPWTIGVYFEKDVPAGSSFLDAYIEQIEPCRELISIHEGNILDKTWIGEPIEVLFIDAAKHWSISDHIVKHFFPSLVPGHSIVVQQDYIYGMWNGWIPVTMEYLSDYFRILDIVTGSVIFKYEKQVPEDVFDMDIFADMELPEIIRLYDRAINRFGKRHRAILRQSRDQLLSIMQI